MLQKSCIWPGIACIAFLWITIASLLWSESVVKELFVIPISALFAFTSVRSNMPGAPVGFGEPAQLIQLQFSDVTVCAWHLLFPHVIGAFIGK